jgi:lipoate-protein ligase A
VSIKSKEGLIKEVDIGSIEFSADEHGHGEQQQQQQSLPLTALAVGMEGQRYEGKSLDVAIEKIVDEAPEVFSPRGAVEKVRDVAQWLKDDL